MPAWRHWYHTMTSTYGSWLPGDPRGFRTRSHREHVEGDYRNPPPTDLYARRHAAARSRLRHPPVSLCPEARWVVLDEFLETLAQHKVNVIAMAVGVHHLHVLAQFPPATNDFRRASRVRTSAIDDPVRHLMGQAKQWSSKRLLREGYLDSAPVWAKRGKIVAVRDRRHQLNVFNYIIRHANEGAVVWSCRDAPQHRSPR